MNDTSPFIKHILFQKGCYLDETTVDNDIYFVDSSLITDFGWKYIYSHNIHNTISFINSSEKSNFTVFYQEIKEKNLLLDTFPNSKSHVEAWLEMDISNIKESDNKFDNVIVSKSAIPSDDYIKVFSNILTDLGVTEKEALSFTSQYSASLKKAINIPNVSVRHIVGYSESEAVSVASIYFDKDDCALYNVGTLIGSKNKGYGKNISELALIEASKNNIKSVFLQCESGGYVENIYRSIGFTSISDETGFIEIER